MQLLDEFQATDELLNASLLSIEFAGALLRESESIGHGLEGLALGEGGLAALDQLGEMLARCLDDLLRHGEIDRPSCSITLDDQAGIGGWLAFRAQSASLCIVL